LKNHCRGNGAADTFLNMLLGYARASTEDQTARLQLDALEAAGCERTFSERASGAAAERPALAELLSHSRSGDTLVVWRLDRLGCSLPHLIETVRKLESGGVGLRSLTEGIDTTTPTGPVVFHLFGALAQFERELIRERTMAGLAAARARGRKGGRPPKLSAEKLRVAQHLLEDPESTVSEVARTLGVHRSTLHKALHGAAARQVVSPGVV
jgi:DNA invertase Pin-like site-specific DNA recombinase